MQYTVRHAKLADIAKIHAIYEYARKYMAESGNPNQWGNTYPSTNQILQDIDEEKLFVISDGQEIHGVFFFWIGNDPTYNRIDGKWRSDCPYGTIHRIAGDGSGGILKAAVAFGEKQIEHLRIDTHEDNHVMQSAVKKLGFQRSGIIYLEDGSPRIGYDYLTAEK